MLSAEHAHIVVRRDKLLENALLEVRKTRFDPTKLLNVSDVRCPMCAWSWETGYNLLAFSTISFFDAGPVCRGGGSGYWRAHQGLFIQEVVRHYCVGGFGDVPVCQELTRIGSERHVKEMLGSST